jgi:hypothetical protein
MKEFRLTVFVIVFLFVITGCSSKGELRVQRGLDTRIDHGAVASLSVRMEDAIREAVDEVIVELKSRHDKFWLRSFKARPP